jgi:tetratricopeptide (TPR) repeat protein
MQDEIVARLAGALNAELIAAEARRAARAPSPDSMDRYFQGMAWLHIGHTPDNVAQARGFFDRALATDPGDVDALVRSAFADARTATLLSGADPTALFAAAEGKLTKALSLAPDDARAHLVLGYVYIYTKRAARGIAECEHALALDRNLAHAHAMIGFGKHFIGRAEETEAHVADALRLSPRDSMAYFWMTYAGIASNALGRWEQSISWFRRSIEANRNLPNAHFALAAALAQLGRLEEAHSTVLTGLALDPAFAISHFRSNLAARSDNPTFLAQLGPILEGMRMAGIPEQ